MCKIYKPGKIAIEFHWILFLKGNYPFFSIGSDNDLVPTMGLAIIWTNYVYFTDIYALLGHSELIKFGGTDG